MWILSLPFNWLIICAIIRSSVGMQGVNLISTSRHRNLCPAACEDTQKATAHAFLSRLSLPLSSTVSACLAAGEPQARLALSTAPFQNARLRPVQRPHADNHSAARLFCGQRRFWRLPRACQPQPFILYFSGRHISFDWKHCTHWLSV